MLKPTFIDLFSGAGFFSAGFVAGGFKPVLAIDQDADAIESYTRNVGGCAEVRDVRSPSQLERVDVLLAGPPCQGFSTLGSRDPADIRNRLALAIDEWAAALLPTVIVIENVPPFLKSSTWKRLTSRLRRRDYEIQTWTLNAADYGVPQRRARAFTIASRVGPIREPRRLNKAAASRVVFERPVRASDPLNQWPSHAGIAEQRIRLVPQCGDRRDILAAAPALCPPSWFKLGCQVTDAWGRMDPNEPANTLRCTFQNPSKGRYLHPSENRVISLREGARLQGAPDRWTFTGGRYSITRQIGNGVPVPLGAAVAKEVMRALR